jgi:ribA/ribD-fused uncharacterized protein
MIDDLEQLRARVRRGDTVRYLLFWGHKPRYHGSVDASCLSQWFAEPFDVDGDLYMTAEHFMMAEKARLFGDHQARMAILDTEHPSDARKIGRSVRAFNEVVWRQQRIDIVVRGNLAKFSQHESLREFLLSSGERVLVEASPSDLIWGSGLAASDPKAEQPLAWPGSNLLGFALMRVRELMRIDLP